MESVHEIKERDRMEEPSCNSPKEYEKENRRNRAIAVLLLGCCVLTSIYLIARTPVSDWFHLMRMKKIITDYDETVAALSVEERTCLREAALSYNSRLRLGTHFRLNQEELEEYGAQLDLTGTGMMGYIRIPKIHVSLPIYHTAEEDVLEKAVGHIPGSSLPVGGDTCHTVLCGHRDQSDAYLFHDLDKLEIGDTFTLTVLDETITYEVDQIRIVFPRQVDDLAIEEGKDYCTLVTCHPHGSSTYRMLVRGKRV